MQTHSTTLFQNKIFDTISAPPIPPVPLGVCTVQHILVEALVGHRAVRRVVRAHAELEETHVVRGQLHAQLEVVEWQNKSSILYE